MMLIQDDRKLCVLYPKMMEVAKGGDWETGFPFSVALV